MDNSDSRSACHQEDNRRPPATGESKHHNSSSQTAKQPGLLGILRRSRSRGQSTTATRSFLRLRKLYVLLPRCICHLHHSSITSLASRCHLETRPRVSPFEKCHVNQHPGDYPKKESLLEHLPRKRCQCLANTRGLHDCSTRVSI